MNKIFLSHSSKDKPYVSYIANQFGKDHCTYDAACFEAGMKNLDEIFREMDKSSIFVVFISDASLESDWVKKELSIADERLHHDAYKLSQIFPIIIDSSITHSDPRIPDFLKRGFGSYNLRVIKNCKVAYRKIKAQQTRLLLENKISGVLPCYYGRDSEITSFKEAFDISESIKCVIASGLPGVGRSSYLLECLRRTQIIETYYSPPTISVKSVESIEDIIVKLSEVGFGDYAIEDVAALANMDSKIDVLAHLLGVVQDYKEQVLIYDENCLVDRRGDVAYWFEKALEKIRPEVTVLIAARSSVHPAYCRKNKYAFSVALSPLSKKEWLGLMRVYAKQVGLDISQEDRNYFTEIITGYPPQVIYAVDLMKATSIEEVKNNPHKIIEYFSPKVTSMLESIIPAELKDDAYGLLAFISTYGIVPSDLLQLVLKIKDEYQKSFSLFKTLTICKSLGVAGEYIEINTLVSDYIQRSKFKLPSDIKMVLENRLDEISGVVNSGKNTMAEDFEDIKFYLKNNIMNGSDIPDRFMYSTLYMSSIYDLYNRQKYTQVIALVEKLKDTGAFMRYDRPVQDRIQSYYCRALARETKEKFYTEVEYFNPRNMPHKQDEYNFLRGFMCRHESKYDKALEWFLKVLANQPKHKSAMREIVAVYRGLEDFENSYEYAKANYINDPENSYHIQPYFEILIRKNKPTRTAAEEQHIDDMLATIIRINQSKPSTTYYEILGQHAAFVETDRTRSLAILNEGIQNHPDSSYLIKYLFDCCEHFNDIQGMNDALSKMEGFAKSNKSAQVAYNIRMARFYAYKNKPKDFIFTSIEGISGLNADAKQRLKNQISGILKSHN